MEAVAATDVVIGRSSGGRQSRTHQRWTRHTSFGPSTDPSSPRYRKVVHGTTISARIGIRRMRSECLQFRQCLERLERLSPLPPVV